MLSLLTWLRIKDAELDRDYAPYAYPAVNGTGYLESGHHDIKPPLIHWSYKLWWKITSLMPKSLTANAKLRLLPSLGLSLASVLLATQSPVAGLTLALLCASPSLWAHMANTEWLTVTLWALALATSGAGWGPWPWLFLGLTPWANQKNALLLAPVAWALGLSLSPIGLVAFCLPSMTLILYLAITGRLTDFVRHCFTVPSRMGKDRTLKQNTLGHLHLLKPGVILMVPFLACVDWQSPWALVLLACVALSVWSKQIVPHHFILWTFPLAMASKPGAMAFVAYAVVWAFRDLAIYLRPENLYRITFGAPQGDYGMRLEDGAWVARWLNLRGVKEVWVNGMDNNVYLQGPFKAWNMVVPEWRESFEGQPPKYIVHCPGSIEFDYDKHGYEMVETSPRNSYIILERK